MEKVVRELAVLVDKLEKVRLTTKDVEKKTGKSAMWLMILVFLSDAKKEPEKHPTTRTHIGHETSMHFSIVAATLPKMVKKGLIEGGGNGPYSITDAGEAYIAEAEKKLGGKK